MPYTKQEIQTIYSLSPEDVEQKLTSANLPLDQETYTDEEIQSSFVIDEEFNNGQATQNTVVAESSEPSKKIRKAKKSSQPDENGVSESKCLNISELLSLAASKVGTRISLIEAGLILDACGLPDQEQYTDAECDRFLAACDLVKKQGKSYDSVAASATDGAASLECDPIQQVERVIGVIENQASAVTEELLQERAESQALTDAQKYMLHYAKAATEGQQVQAFWSKLRDHSRARLMGKSQARLIRAEPPTTLILSPSPNSTNSFENSENGTNEE